MKLLPKPWGRHLLRFVTLTLAFIAVQGCGGYYNTFYNTKKVYKEALDEQKRRVGDNKPGAVEIQKYDKAVEKASKLLQLHPKSRYVDDALLLIGECFYYKQEYLKAQRKFQELVTLFPKSGLVPRALLWLAKTNIELNDYAGAERTLNELQQREKKGELVHQAQYYLGEIYFRQQQYTKAAREYEVAARKLSDEKMRAAAYMRLGECCLILQQFDLAAGAFRRASAAAKNDLNLKFKARLHYARALKNDRRFDEALVVLNDMLRDFSTHREIPLVKLEMAECTKLQGKIDSAIKQCTSIIENHQRTDASAAAYFMLGEIYEDRGEFNKAKESFDNVRRESARSEKVTEAGQRSKAIGDLIKLKETIATLEKQRESLAKGDSLHPAGKTLGTPQRTVRRSISRMPRRARMAGTMPTASKTTADPNKIAADLAQSKILLAELYLFNFNRPDSAMREYLDVFEFFPQTEYAPQAMYSLAYILGDAPATRAMRDSIYQVLATQYGDTPQGRDAKRRLGRADTLATPQSLPDLFREAEDCLFNKKDPHRALRLYQEFLQEQPKSKLAPQSLYAMGWIYEHKLADNKEALATYKKLIESYPDSPMARRVRPKVTAAEQKKAEPAKSDQAVPAEVQSQKEQPPVQPEVQNASEPGVEDDEVLSSRRKNTVQPRPPVPDAAPDQPPREKDLPENEKEPEPPRIE
ncbi:MAG: tetratricopeptide repeat protein [candidate division KSB1 bacterium]|nr:tetratricopeptide repeat protein [candidate division KSB1 bacterium]MDZ7303415.1 tetratricopeptide repeat protein [candidate division KSB1 bacterium]MDZ7312497.1 tetratricopeptide repeat protein [candidate division KSB1 bacterium]